jgi:hypothetical protein
MVKIAKFTFFMVFIYVFIEFQIQLGSGSETSSYGSGKKFRILTDPDPQHLFYVQKINN